MLCAIWLNEVAPYQSSRLCQCKIGYPQISSAVNSPGRTQALRIGTPPRLNAQIAIARNAAASTNANEKLAEKDRPRNSDANAHDVESGCPSLSRCHKGTAIAASRNDIARL